MYICIYIFIYLYLSHLMIKFPLLRRCDCPNRRDRHFRLRILDLFP